MRNLFALIQGIREAIDGGDELPEEYHHDEGTFEDPSIPENEGVAEDSDDAYEDGEEDFKGEAEEEEEAENQDPEPTPEPRRTTIRKALRKHRRKSRSMSKAKKPKMNASPSKPAAPVRGLPSMDSLDEACTPPPKLPRANTDESYADALSDDREQELSTLLARINEAHAGQAENPVCI